LIKSFLPAARHLAGLYDCPNQTRKKERIKVMRTLRFALAQVNPTMGDFAVNTRKIRDMLSQAKTAGIDLVIFPEMALCGYPPEDLLHRTAFLDGNQQALTSLLPHTSEMTAIVGFAHHAGKHVYNSAAVLHDGKIAAIYNKIELPNYGVFDEKRYFTPGERPLLIDYAGKRGALTICEDIWIEGGKAEAYIQNHHVDIILNLSASPFHAGKIDLRRQMLSQLAKRTQTFIGYVNLVGGQDELVFDGGSMVIDPSGNIVTSGAHFQETLLLVQIQLNTRDVLHTSVSSASIQCKSFVSKPGRSIANVRVAEPSWLEEIYSALVLGTQDYVRKNGFEKVVIGLSGGIDSALTAAIAVDALGSDNVVGVTMPSVYTSPETRSDAECLADNLALKLLTIPIKSILASYQESLQDVFGAGNPGIEHENLQARIRGNILMALSNRFGWLVLTTGNKSETAVGYCTLYGDMAGGFAVIKDVPKTLVYELVRYVNQKAGYIVIPQSIIDRPPTAELRPNQRDEDSLPPYPVLDKILKAYVEEDLEPDAIIARGFGKQVVMDSIRLVDQSEYKRRQAPPGVKITPKAFGRDRRLPITNHFRQNLPK